MKNNNFIKLYNNKWTELSVRWLLGIVFVCASYHKITEPAQFAKIIYGYDLFPSFSINLIAIILPYLEFYSGLALILGIYPRSAVLVINGMLFAFIIALSVNLVRGHEFDCGCISFGEAGHTSSTAQLLIRDILMFMMGLYVFFSDRPESGSLTQMTTLIRRGIFMRKKTVTSLLLIACLLMIPTADADQGLEKFQIQSDTEDTGESVAGVPVAVVREPRFQFSPALDGTVITHDFIIENMGNKPLSIAKVATSCGCTTADYPKKIKPGDKDKIIVKADTRGYADKKFAKTVTLHTNDPQQKQIRLRISGKVERFALIQPERVFLRGSTGDKIQSVVSITPEKKYPFNIVKSYSDNLEKKAGFILEKKQDKYFCTINNLSETSGSYRGKIYLKTDSAVKPEIIIYVYGAIAENKS
ncbi:OS_HP2 family (seleno)protein [Desulfonema magnum]|uniref:MauE domain-containing protein n=1 Tax=Desulfonema magnum TaxID=45655 RepID=A0A975BRZ6_9BACT|nr:OS_HP2 family (seleno)protein [Desulfonema magnum]QTA90500.1 MauE domain-containing protein [Desulfonema magnum]